MHEQDQEQNFHSQVRKAVFSDAIQHPTTLLPAAVSILTAAQMAVMAPTRVGFAVALISGFLTLSSFIYHYVVRGEKNAEKFAKSYRNQKEQEQLQGLRDLIAECRQTGFVEGIKEGGEFETAYLNLTRYLQNLNEPTRDRVRKFLILANDCYRQGINILHDAKETHKVVFAYPVVQLKDELAMWSDQVGDLEALIAQGQTHLQGKLEALNSKIQNHRSRIDTYQDKRTRLEQLMAELESLEGALETAYLEVVDLISAKTLPNLSMDSASQLERAVLAAKRVEERLTAKPDPKEDQIYKDAAN